MSTEQRTERTRCTRELFDGVRCAPSLNPFRAGRGDRERSDNIGTGVRNYLVCQGAEKGCGGFPKGEGNSTNGFQLFAAGGLHYFWLWLSRDNA